MPAPTEREIQLFQMMAELAGSVLAAEGVFITLISAMPDETMRNEALAAFKDMSAKSRRYVDLIEKWNDGW